jgi:Magnesium chelatase, subunit ChlI
MRVLTAMVVIHDLHRRGGQGLGMLPELTRPIRHDTQAEVRLSHQPGRLDLTEGLRRRLARVDLVPAQHLDGPVLRDQVEPAPFGFPPCPRPPGPLGPNLLPFGPRAGKSMLARRLTTILPALSLAEAIETTRINSIAGPTGARRPRRLIRVSPSH